MSETRRHHHRSRKPFFLFRPVLPKYGPNQPFSSLTPAQNVEYQEKLHRFQQKIEEQNRRYMSRKREVARQDVMLTPEGPVELYRRDSNGHERSLTADKITKLTTKYKNHKRKEYRRNASIRGNYDYVKPRVTYRNQDRRRGGSGRPCPYSRDYNRLAVSGDKIIEKHPTRSYIYHRQPFDWYNSCNIEILDDIEEVVRVPGTLSRPHTKSIYATPSISSSSRMYRQQHHPRWYEDEEDYYSDEYDDDDYEGGEYSDYYDDEQDDDDYEDYSYEDARHRRRRDAPTRSQSSSHRSLRKTRSEPRISERGHPDRIRMKSNEVRARNRMEDYRASRRQPYQPPRPTCDRRRQPNYARVRRSQRPIDDSDYEVEYEGRRGRRYIDDEYDSDGSGRHEREEYDDYDKRSEDSLSDGSVEVTSSRRQRRVVIKTTPKYDSDKDETSSSPSKQSKARSQQPSYEVHSQATKKTSASSSDDRIKYDSVVTDMGDMYISKSSPTKTRRPELIEERDSEDDHAQVETIVTNKYLPDEVEEVRQPGRTVLKRIITEVVKPGDPSYKSGAGSSVTFK